MQEGRYVGISNREPVEITVEQRRGYFELTGFSGTTEDCQRKVLGFDVSPAAFIDADGAVDFKALGGRVTVDIRFHHKSHAEGHIAYSHGDCTRSNGFGARLKLAEAPRAGGPAGDGAS